jgi:replication fork protection complex subunit Csm3/Swi3
MSSPGPAARAQPASAPAAGGDDFDDLFDYDVELDEVFRDLEPRKPASPKDASRKERSDGLGIDKEVEVVKKARAPRVKLDENRYIHELTKLNELN